MGTHHLDFKLGGRIYFSDFKKDILNSALVFGPITNPTLSFTYIRGKMVQPRYLLAWTIVVAVISLNCDNCNAAIVNIGNREPAMDLSNLDLDDMDKWLEDDEDDIDDLDDINDDDDLDLDELDKWLDDDSYDLNMLDRKLTPTKWLKRQVRQLWRALALIRSDIKDNGDAIGDLETDIDTNKVDIQTNSKNITDNEEDIGENEEAIIDNYDEIGINREKIENLTISIEEKIEMHAELIANNTNATKENEMMIQQNKDDIHTNLGHIIDLLDLNPRRYLTFGGFLNDTVKTTDSVYLVEVDPFNNITTSCLSSTLPAVLKESHVFEWNNTLLVCSSFSSISEANLNCFSWDEVNEDWIDFVPQAPDSNGISGFPASVKIPGWGIWFLSRKKGLFLNETDGNWHTLFWDDTNSDDFARHRAKACMVEVSDNEVALIGGTPVTLGDVIDVYNIEDKTFSMDHLTLPFIRSHLSCTHIPQGVNGNPTVAILGDDNKNDPGDGEVYAMEMALWDTITNTITLVPHPPGYENLRLFRPIIKKWSDDTILLAAGVTKTFDASTEGLLEELWLYKIGEGWISTLPTVPPPLTQYDMYMLNPDFAAYDSLNKCE